MDAKQFRSQLDMMADVYDRLHSSYSQLQAQLNARAADGSARAPDGLLHKQERSRIIELGSELEVKVPNRPYIIELGTESSGYANTQSPGSVTETHSFLNIQGTSTAKSDVSQELAAGTVDSHQILSTTEEAQVAIPDNDKPQLSLQINPFAGISRKYQRPAKSLTSDLLRPHFLTQVLLTLRKRRSKIKRMSYIVHNRQGSFRKLLESSGYDFVMTCTIALNIVLLIMETDTNAACYKVSAGCAPAWMVNMNLILLGIYTFEMFIVLDVYRCSILRKTDRLLELLIVVFGYCDLILTRGFGSGFLNMQALKSVRLMRLLRGVRLLRFCPELHVIVLGFAGAMRTMFWGFATLMLLIVVFALVAVEVIHPLNQSIQQGDPYCDSAFESVWNTVMLFFQTLAAGDSWGSCTLPIIKRFPASFLLFAGSFICVQVGFLNLIMSVTLDRVSEAREKNVEGRIQEKQKVVNASRIKWFKLFETLDTDGSGEVSLEELVKGFDSLPDFNADLKLLGIEREDLPQLLCLMDEDSNNVLSVDELLCTFDLVMHFDTKMHQITMGMQTRMIGQRLERMIANVQTDIDALAAGHSSWKAKDTAKSQAVA